MRHWGKAKELAKALGPCWAVIRISVLFRKVKTSYNASQVTKDIHDVPVQFPVGAPRRLVENDRGDGENGFDDVYFHRFRDVYACDCHCCGYGYGRSYHYGYDCVYGRNRHHVCGCSDC